MSTASEPGSSVVPLHAPSHSIESEQAALGAILVDARAWAQAAEILCESDFYAAQHRTIFRRMAPLASEGRADVVTVGEALRHAGELDQAGGFTYLHQLVHAVPSSANVAHYSRRVAEHARRRELAAAGTALADAATRPSGPNAVDLLGDTRRRVDDIETRIAQGQLAGARASHVWLDEAKLPPAKPELLNGLIGERDFVLIYGEPSCGKTFFVLSVGNGIAAEIPCYGRQTRRTPVAYVAAEAGRSIMRRHVAWRDRFIREGREDRVPLAIIPRAFNLLDAAEVAALLRQLREMGEEAGEPVGLVIIDTLSRSMPGGDENSAEDMTRVIAAADRIRDHIGAAVVFIHHSGKDKTKGARGHSALAAAADVVVNVENRVATFEKVRDGVANVAIPFELEVVEVGRREDGEPITTCVAVPCDEPPSLAGPRLVGLGGNQEKALGILRKLFANARKNLEERGDDPAGACILIAGWRAACEDKGIDHRRWPEVRGALEKRGLIRFEGPHVEIVEALS